MTYVARFSSRARKEIMQAWAWYEDRQPGLGNRFEEEVKKRIFDIEQNPGRYPQRNPPYRETGIKIFPDLIIYKIKKKQELIEIISVFHAKKNPAKKYTLRRK